MEKLRTISINPNNKVVLRDTEVFNYRLGLGFYSPNFLEKYKNRLEGTGTTRVVWLERETGEVMRILRKHPMVLIRGELGIGKGAIIYGLRSWHRDIRKSYCYIDGHHIPSPKQINSSLRWAQINKATIFWDSWDYLIVKPRRKRKIGYEKHVRRTEEILNILYSYLDNNRGRIRFVATCHDDGWLERYKDDYLFNKLQSLINDFVFFVYRVKGILCQTEFEQFLKHAGFRDDIIESLWRLGENFPQLRTYRTVKLLALSDKYGAPKIRKRLNQGLIPKRELEIFISITEQQRRKVYE